MKRSGPIQRKTPLKRSGPLARGKPIDRSGPLTRSGPLPAKSAKTAERDEVYPERRLEVYERAKGRCEACKVHWLDECSHQCEQVHHLAGREGPDPHRLDNLLGVGFRHHLWIEENREAAYDLGLLIRRNGINRG